MSDTTQLACCQLTPTDQLVVQLVRPADMPAVRRTTYPAVVRITWPSESTIVDPKQFPETAAGLTRLFAGASTALARLKAGRRVL